MADPSTKPAPRVLTIEDTPEVRTLIRRVLEPKGFEVLEASDGLAGLDLAIAHPPDLILCDIKMPGMDGYQIATALRTHPELAGVPIVMLTTQGDRELALSVGADGFIEKPIDIKAFPGQLRAYLEGKREHVPADDESRQLRAYTQSVTGKLEQTVRELTAANSQLRTTMRTKQEFMQNLSHELATPLTPVIGYVKMLRSGRLGALTEQQTKALDSMSTSVERLARAIDNLVDFATLESGKGLIAHDPFDAAAMVKAVFEEARAKARARRVHVLTLLGPSLTGYGDERKVKQALASLLDNAIKFGPVGGEVLLRAAVEGDRLYLEVYDQGSGVLPEEAEKVFVPFFHADRGDERAPGAGLGLPVAKQIVEAHGGEIRVESPPKNQPEGTHHYQGAKVWFWVPAHAPVPEPAAP